MSRKINIPLLSMKSLIFVVVAFLNIQVYALRASVVSRGICKTIMRLTETTEDTLDSMTVAQLKSELKSHNLKVAGRKSELIDRLREYRLVAAELEVTDRAVKEVVIEEDKTIIIPKDDEFNEDGEEEDTPAWLAEISDTDLDDWLFVNSDKNNEKEVERIEDSKAPSYASRLRRARRDSDWRAAVSVLAEMDKAGIEVTRNELQIALVAACKAVAAKQKESHLVSQAEALAPGTILAEMVKKNQVEIADVLSAIVAANHCARPQLALRWISLAKQLAQAKENLSDEEDETLKKCYSIALSACRRRADAIYREERRKSKRYQNNYDDDRQRLASAGSKNKRKNVDTMSAETKKERTTLASAAFILAKDLIKLDETRPARNEFTIEMATVLAVATCGRCGDADKAKSVLSLAKLRAARRASASWPSAYLYVAVLSALEAANRHNEALALLDEVPPASLTVAVFNIGLKLCAKRGDVRKAVAVLDEMRNSNDLRCRPDAYSYATAIRACVEARRSRDALNLLSLALDDHVANEVSFRSTVRACLGFDLDPDPKPADAYLGLFVLYLQIIRAPSVTLYLDATTRKRLANAAHNALQHASPPRDVPKKFHLSSSQLEHIIETYNLYVRAHPSRRPHSSRVHLDLNVEHGQQQSYTKIDQKAPDSLVPPLSLEEDEDFMQLLQSVVDDDDDDDDDPDFLYAEAPVLASSNEEED